MSEWVQTWRKVWEAQSLKRRSAEPSCSKMAAALGETPALVPGNTRQSCSSRKRAMHSSAVWVAAAFEISRATASQSIGLPSTFSLKIENFNNSSSLRFQTATSLSQFVIIRLSWESKLCSCAGATGRQSLLTWSLIIWVNDRRHCHRLSGKGL